jgi:hypothetical protein
MMRRTDHEPFGGTMHPSSYPPPPPAARPPRWGRFIAWTCAAAVAAFAIAGGVAALTKDDDGDGPVASPAACKAALADNYRKVMANGGKGPTASEPPACVGLDQKTLERSTGEVVDEYLKSDQAKKDFGRLLESPSP